MRTTLGDVLTIGFVNLFFVSFISVFVGLLISEWGNSLAVLLTTLSIMVSTVGFIFMFVILVECIKSYKDIYNRKMLLQEKIMKLEKRVKEYEKLC